MKNLVNTFGAAVIALTATAANAATITFGSDVQALTTGSSFSAAENINFSATLDDQTGASMATFTGSLNSVTKDYTAFMDSFGGDFFARFNEVGGAETFIVNDNSGSASALTTLSSLFSDVLENGGAFGSSPVNGSLLTQGNVRDVEKTEISPVPLPASSLLLLAGLGGLGCVASRRKRAL